MSLVSITITGIYQDASEALLTNKVIRFAPVGVFGDDGAVIPSTEVRVRTHATTGAFSVDLLTSDIADAYVRYQVVFHNGSRRKFDLTDDAPTISLEDLLNAYDPTDTASSSVDWLNHEARLDALEIGGGAGAVTWSAGTLSGARASIVFADSNGIGFGMSGSTITASHNALTDSSPFRLTAQNSQLQFTSANSNFLGTGATQSFRHTSADSQLRFTSADTQLRFTSADSQLQFTSANSNFLGTAATQSFRHTSADSQLRFTSADSQLRFTSADSQLQFTSANSNLLGTVATASFRFTSQNSQLRFTSADSQLRFTSADSQLRFTSADSQLQFTSANTKFVQEWALTGNTAGTTSSAQGSRLFLSAGSNITLSGSSNSIVIHGASGGVGGAAALSVSAGTLSGTRDSLVFSDANAVSFGMNGSTITASIPGATSLSATGAVSISANGSTISIGAPVQSADTLGFYALGNTTQSSSGTFDARSMSVTAGGMVSAGWTGGSLAFSAPASSVFLGTGATASFRHTSADTQLQFTSANSNFLGTAATQSFQFTSVNSLSLGTGATVSFRHTSADTQLRFTSADSQLRFTSADTQLQFTSANTKFAQEWMLTGNTSGTSSSVQGSRWYFSGGANMTISGSSNSLVFSAGTAAPSPVNFSAGTTSSNLGSVVFSNSNLVSFGLNGATITGSVPGTSSLSATGIMSISVNASTISIGAKHPDHQYFEADDIQGMGLMTNLTAINTTPFFVPFILKGNLTNSSLLMQVSRSTSGSNAFTVQAGIYSYVNATQISLMGSLQNAFSGGNTASFSGVRYLKADGWGTGATAMTPGAYVLALNFSANGGNTASMNYSLFGGLSASQPVGFIGSGTDQNTTAPGSQGPMNFWGRYTAGSAALPSSVGQSQLQAGFTGASQPLAPWFVLRS